MNWTEIKGVIMLKISSSFNWSLLDGFMRIMQSFSFKHLNKCSSNIVQYNKMDK